jgi:streptogramin lyase
MNLVYFLPVIVLLFAYAASTNAWAEGSIVTAKSLGPDQLDDPVSIAIDKTGGIYVSDSGNHSILKFDPNGKFLSKFGSYGRGAGQIISPTGVAVDSIGNIFVVDQGNGRVEKFDPSGKFLMQFGSSGSQLGQLNLPINIVIDSHDNIYVDDMDNSRIQKFDPLGGYLLQFPNNSVDQSQYLPDYIAIDNSSNIYVLTAINPEIEKFDAAGNFVMKFKISNGTKTFYSAFGVAADKTGNVYVTTSGQILKFDPSGRFLNTIGTQGINTGQMDQSQGIAIDNAGNVYVADAGNKRIDKFDSSGKFLLSFGSSTQPAVSLKQEPPITIDQVELYGPSTNQTICDSSGTETKNVIVGQTSQWFELYNPTNNAVQADGYDFEITHPPQIEIPNITSDTHITIGPHQRCVFALFNTDGPAIDDPRNVVISFAYRYNGTEYAITTPLLTDTYNDTRTWQLVDRNWIFAASSPYKQLQSGVKAGNVVCNKDFVSLERPQHSLICVEPSNVQRLESLGWTKIIKSTYIPVIDQLYYSGPGYSCRFIFPHLSITNSSGFDVYNDSEITNYTFLPGYATGTITYKIFGPSYGLDPPVYSPSKTNVTNGAYLYYDTASGRVGSETNSLFGVTVSYQPKSEIVNYNDSAAVIASISANSTAKQGTYGIDFVPGGCAGAPFIDLNVGVSK